MTPRIRLAAGSVVIGLAVISAPLSGQMPGMAPATPGGQHQMGQMPMAQGPGHDMMGGESCPMMKDMMMNMAKADGAADAQALEEVFAAIGVTDAQKVQMNAVKDQHQAEIATLTARADARKLELRLAIQSLTFDEAGVRAKSTALAAAITDSALAELRVRAEAFKVLTPEQQKKAATIQRLQLELKDLLKPAAKM